MTRRTVCYLLRFAPDEKAELEQLARELSAREGRRITLADALRDGARVYLEINLGALRDDG